MEVLKSREQDRHWITFGYNSELQLRRIGNEADRKSVV